MLLPNEISLSTLDSILELLRGGGSQFGLVGSFLLAAALVIVAGYFLSKYGDALGERTGMGEGLVGIIFLAGVTSMPELVVSTTSALTNSLQALQLDPSLPEFHALMRGGSDLALGNMLGSNVFNLMLFVVMDLIQGHGAFIHLLSRNHVMSAASGLAMLGLLLFGFAIGDTSGYTIPWLQTGVITPLLLFGYMAAMILQHKVERRVLPDATGANEPVSDAGAVLLTMPAARFYGILAFFAFLIVIGGIWLSLVGDAMARPASEGGFGLGQSFVGTVFLALATSLPELAICISAVRSKLYNMAVGNVLGSNIFNLVIVFTSDIGLRGGSILTTASNTHLLTVAMVMVLTSVVIISLILRSTRSFARLGIDTWVILFIYIFGNIALYVLSMPDDVVKPQNAAASAVPVPITQTLSP